MQKYLDDRYLLLAVIIITTPALVVLIIQASTYPITLHSQTTINKVLVKPYFTNLVQSQDNLAEEEITYICKAKYHLVFDLVLILIRTILGIFSLTIAFQIKKHLPTEKKYRKYNESAVINLSTIMVIIPLTICELIVFLFHLNNMQTGLLLIITLRECLWMYPMSYLLFIPKVSNMKTNTCKSCPAVGL